MHPIRYRHRYLRYFPVLLYLLPGLLSAQTYLYPIKVNHRWGFINQRAEVVVEPYYDVLGEEELPFFSWPPERKAKSPFRTVERDSMLGLIDELMQAVLQARYRRIRPLAHDYFAVSFDSLYTIIDRREVPLLPALFKEILYLGTTDNGNYTYFMVRDLELWGVYDQTGREILPQVYRAVQLLSKGNGNFMVRSENQEDTTAAYWGLVDRDNNRLLPENYVEIKDCTDNFFAAREKQEKAWSTWDSMGKPIFAMKWLHLRPLNKHIIALHDTLMRSYLFLTARRDTLPWQGPGTRYNPLDERFILHYDQGMAGILDSNANPVLDPVYQQIKPTNDPDLFLVCDERWGLYDIKKKAEVLACQYREIGPFLDGYAEVRGDFGLGLINRAMEQVIPLRFSSIQREGLIFKAFRGQETSIYELNDAGQVVSVEDYGNVRTIRVRSHAPAGPLEAQVVRRVQEMRGDEYFMRKYPSPESRRASYLSWRFDPDSLQWALTHKDTTGLPIFHRYQRAYYIVEAPALRLIAHRAFAVGGPFARLLGSSRTGLAPIFLYHEKRKEPIETAAVLTGLRRHDFERKLPYAATIDAWGKFGLIDTLGREVADSNGRALRFTYIGEFIDGYARVCTGGKLKKKTNEDDGKTTLEPLSILIEKFCITPMQGGRFDFTNLLTAADGDSEPQWGVIDTAGRMIIEPQYAYLREPVDGQMAAKGDNTWGVIDLEKDTVIGFRYANVSDYYGAWRILDRAKGVVFFNQRGWQVIDREYSGRGLLVNDRCRVRRDSLWGYIDGNGAQVTPFAFSAAGDFSENIAAVRVGESWKLIDQQGRELSDLSALAPDTLGTFSEGLCWFSKAKKYGYLNKEGEVVIEPLYSRAFDFAGGVARVVSNRSTILIDKAGAKLVEEGRYQRIDAFNSDGLAVAAASVKDAKYALLHAGGRQLTSMQYDEIGAFQEGFAPVRMDQLHGFINRQGELVIPPAYERVRPFSHGLAAAMLPGKQKWIFIDTTGRQVIRKTYDVVNSDYDGRYIDVRELGQDPSTRRLIDGRGEAAGIDLRDVKFYRRDYLGLFRAGGSVHYFANLRKEPLFDDAFEDIEPFAQGVSVVKNRGRKGVINERGMLIVRPKYFYLEPQPDGLILAGPPAFGVADRSGKIIIEADYDSVELMSGGLYRVEQGEKVGYIDLEGRWVWRLGN